MQKHVIDQNINTFK